MKKLTAILAAAAIAVSVALPAAAYDQYAWARESLAATGIEAEASSYVTEKLLDDAMSEITLCAADPEADDVKPLTRAEALDEICGVLRGHFMLETDAEESALGEFTDAQLVTERYIPAFAYMVQNGYISGSGSLLRPNDKMTAAELAVTLDKVFLQSGSGKTIAMFTMDSSLFDDSYNQLCWSSLTARQGEVQTRACDDVEGETAAQKLERIAAIKPDAVIIVAAQYTDEVLKFAEKYPDIDFFILDYSQDSDMDNVIPVTFNVAKGSYAAGRLAAAVSKTGKIGFVGGMDNDVINAFGRAYGNGARSLNKDIEVVTEYVGSFGNSEKAREVARGMIEDGCDVVFQAAGSSGIGVFYACEEKSGVYAIGVDQDQNYLAPDVVIASVVKDVGDAFNGITDAVASDDVPARLRYGTSLSDVYIVETGR